MNNGKNEISSQLASLSDSQLCSIIAAVSAAAGLESEKTQALTSDIPRLRNMLSAMSDKRISQLLSTLGSVDSAEILRKLGEM